MQWHPHFAKLLRALLEGYFDVEINVPVGDAPREADIELALRTRSGPLPYHGLWRHLTPYNVLEYKGPTVSARMRDLELLLKVGLGIDRRLREKGTIPTGAGPEEVSFWYLTHRLGRRFLAQAKDALGAIEPVGPGIWRCRILRRLVFLVSETDLPVESDALPFHVLQPATSEKETALARLLIDEPTLLPKLGDWLLNLHPMRLREIQHMAKSKQLKVSVDPLVEFLGAQEILRQLSLSDKISEDDWVRYYVAQLPEKKRKAMMKRLQETLKSPS